MKVFKFKEKSEEDEKKEWEALQKKAEEGFRRSAEWEKSLSKEDFNEYRILKLMSVPFVLVFLIICFRYYWIGYAVSALISLIWFLAWHKKVFRYSVLPALCFSLVLVASLLFRGTDRIFEKKFMQTDTNVEVQAEQESVLGMNDVLGEEVK